MNKRKILIVAGFIAGIILVILAVPQIMLWRYDAGSANVFDVIAVDLGIKEYVKVRERDDWDGIMLKESKSPDIFMEEHGYTYEYQMGSGYILKDKDGSQVTIVGTSAWCPLFRVYEVSKGAVGKIGLYTMPGTFYKDFTKM